MPAKMSFSDFYNITLYEDVDDVPFAGQAVVVRAAVTADPSKRVVITGQGIASCFGNDVNTFYDKCANKLQAFNVADVLAAQRCMCWRLHVYLTCPFCFAACWRASLA